MQHEMWPISVVRFLNMVSQSGIVCCERCWYNMKCAIWWEMVWMWNVVWLESTSEMVSVWCGSCMWWNVMKCKMQWHCVTYSTSHHHSSTFHIKPHFRHSTSFHITPHFIISIPPDHMVWCAMFCNARCGMLYFIHPVAVAWNKVL